MCKPAQPHVVSEEPSSLVASMATHADSGAGPSAPHPYLVDGTIATLAWFDGMPEGGDLGRLEHLCV